MSFAKSIVGTYCVSFSNKYTALGTSLVNAKWDQHCATSSTKVTLAVPTTVEGSHLSIQWHKRMDKNCKPEYTTKKTPTTGPVAIGIHQMSLSFSENAT
jgi:hypothetical protein